MFKKMKLLEFLLAKYWKIELQNTALVTCQHILQSNYITLQYLFRLGLKPKNTFLLGKAYSSNKKVAEALSSIGVNVHRHSFSFNSHVGFDVQFESYVNDFINDTRDYLAKNSRVNIVIVLDDGGNLISKISKNLFDANVVAVEWTTSGYRKLIGTDLNIPVLNMARSQTKIKLESPIIGEGVVKKITDRYSEYLLGNKKALVIGAGPIGLSVYQSLMENKIPSEIVEIGADLSAKSSLSDILIGCTGQNVLRINELERVKDVLLVSASSSDREFSAVEIRKQYPYSRNSHIDYIDRNRHIILANSGFPINFDGTIQLLPLEKIQVTLGMVFASVCICSSQALEIGFNDFPSELDTEISNVFKNLSLNNRVLSIDKIGGGIECA